MKKRFLIFGVAALVIVVACNNSGNTNQTATDTAKATSTTDNNDGWMSLFDGNTIKGWHGYGQGNGTGRWKVADGTIYIDTAQKTGGADLCTDNEYENFDLKLEWKISRNGNSGVMIYVNEDTAKYKDSYNTGPEMQVLDNDGHPDGKIIKHRAGDLYDLISCSKETVKAVGEWNEVEIKADHGKLDFYLNGTNVVSTTMWDDNWKKMIAGSKFKNMPGFGTFTKGRFALQDHGNLVWYRNIKIKKL